MLRSDHVRVRVKDGQIQPRWLTGAAAKRARTMTDAYRQRLARGIGQRREEVENDLSEVEISVRDRVLAQGLRKLLDDRCTWTMRTDLDPEQVRREVFADAAQAHRDASGPDAFDRAAILRRAAERLSSDPETIEASLYADLRQNEILTEFDDSTSSALVERYNLALAQAVLLRATEVTVELEAGDPLAVRQVFRSARFHGLLHEVRKNDRGGHIIKLDGPFSLFGAVQKYGLRLAMFLPSVLACQAWKLTARARWGRGKQTATLSLCPADPLGGDGTVHETLPPAVEALASAFAKLDTAWKVRPNDDIFALPGEVVCVPDLVFENAASGELVYLEAFGFWSRRAVWQRVELVRKGFPARIILAVGKQLRVSEEVLGEEDAGELYVYKSTMSARALRDRLDRV